MSISHSHVNNALSGQKAARAMVGGRGGVANPQSACRGMCVQKGWTLTEVEPLAFHKLNWDYLKVFNYKIK